MNLDPKGGVLYENERDIDVAKSVDLLTMPYNIGGTNCFNCKFLTNVTKEKGFCSNKNVQLYVNKRQCCALWDNAKSFRIYGHQTDILK